MPVPVIARVLSRLGREQRGFTIVEVLASMLVLAAGIYPAIDIVTRGHQTSATAQNLEIVSRVGTEAVEEMRSLPWATLKAGAVDNSTAIPAGVESPGRVDWAAGTYQAPDGPLEPLLVAASGPLPRYQRITVGSGSGARRLDVWRMPSGRTESCPLVSLTQLTNSITAVQSQLTTALSTLGTLTAASTGLLARVTAEASSAIGSITGILGVGATITALQGASSTAGAVRTQLLGLGTNLTALRTQLTDLQAKLSQGTSNGLISGNLLDLCQLPDDTVVPSVGDLTAIATSLGVLNGGAAGGLPSIVAKATAIRQEIGGIAGALSTLLGRVLALLGIGEDIAELTPGLNLTPAVLATTAGGEAVKIATNGSSQISLSSLLTGETAKVTSLISALLVGNPRNTVRVTVAVRMVDPPAGTGPKLPVYFTTVVTNPKAGLL